MTPEKELLNKAIDALEVSANISVDRRTIKSAKPSADYMLNYETPTGEKKRIALDLKNRLTSTAIGNAALERQNTDFSKAIVSECITSKSALRLRELEMQFFDTAGNAYLQDGKFYTFITGNKIKTSNNRQLGVFRPAGIKLILAFTIEPNLIGQDYRTIEQKTGIPKSSVGRVMKDLEKKQFLVDRGKSGRILRKRKELLDRWVQYFGEKFRPKLKPIRYHSTKQNGRWWDDVDLQQYNAFWGGETAGERLTRYLKPQIATIYADNSLPELRARFGLIRAEDGEIEILKKFWVQETRSEAAPPLVAYADLLATADERNIETAKLIYEKYLANFTEADS